ncbi:hypothetical protein C8R46DRAFT_1301927 [Mycena filopes]|nr:hypothetical protein C8R46DRAFT_1301927 [Mycena filopes]
MNHAIPLDCASIRRHRYTVIRACPRPSHLRLAFAVHALLKSFKASYVSQLIIYGLPDPSLGQRNRSGQRVPQDDAPGSAFRGRPNESIVETPSKGTSSMAGDDAPKDAEAGKENTSASRPRSYVGLVCLSAISAILHSLTASSLFPTNALVTLPMPPSSRSSPCSRRSCTSSVIFWWTGGTPTNSGPARRVLQYHPGPPSISIQLVLSALSAAQAQCIGSFVPAEELSDPYSTDAERQNAVGRCELHLGDGGENRREIRAWDVRQVGEEAGDGCEQGEYEGEGEEGRRSRNLKFSVPHGAFGAIVGKVHSGTADPQDALLSEPPCRSEDPGWFIPESILLVTTRRDRRPPESRQYPKGRFYLYGGLTPKTAVGFSPGSCMMQLAELLVRSTHVLLNPRQLASDCFRWEQATRRKRTLLATTRRGRVNPARSCNGPADPYGGATARWRAHSLMVRRSSSKAGPLETVCVKPKTAVETPSYPMLRATVLARSTDEL